MDSEEKVIRNKNFSIAPKKIFIVILVIVGIFLINSGFYTVNPEEVAVVQRFGEFNKITQPGLHFKIPFGIDNTTKVKVRKVYKEEFGFRTRVSGKVSSYSQGKMYNNESLMLTGDLNIAEVTWIVQFRINDPKNFLFNVRDQRETIRNLSESVMRTSIGDHSVDEVIGISRAEIAYNVERKLQKVLDNYNSGIKIDKVILQNALPPKEVQPAFNEVNSAKQEQEKIINQAWEKYNKVIPEATGKAKQTIEQAKGYRINRVNTAKGDVANFLEVWKEYRNAKSVTKKRLYIETMEKILPRLEKVYIFDEKQKGILPLMNVR